MVASYRKCQQQAQAKKGAERGDWMQQSICRAVLEEG